MSGHMERMSEERLTKRIYMSELEGTRRVRVRMRWKDRVNNIMNDRGLTMREGVMYAQKSEME